MSQKVAIKPPSKGPPVAAATLGKKADVVKTKYIESGKAHGFKAKAASVVERSKAAYGSHIRLPFQKHGTGHGVDFEIIPPTGREPTPVEHESELADKLVAEVAEHSTDVNTLCETYELKREELGRLTGFSLRALAEWAAGSLPSQPAKRRLHEVRRLLDALAQIVKRESIPTWLHKRNAALGNLTPLQVIEVGEMDRLWAMVHDLGSGQPE